MSDGPFLCYRELLGSTNVVKITFFNHYNRNISHTEEYLCVLLTSGISIYQVLRTEGIDSDYDCHLFLKFHEKLFGKARDVVSMYDPHRGGDLLVVSFDVGKLVVLRSNLVNDQFETLILLNSEDNSFGTGADVQIRPNGSSHFLRTATSENLCVCEENALVCATIYDQYLLIVPLPVVQHEELSLMMMDGGVEVSSPRESIAKGVEDDALNKLTNANAPAISQHFVINILTDVQLPGPIIDTCFVTGYSRPVLLVLQLWGMQPVGHVKVVRHTCTVTALAIDCSTKSATILWQQRHLPNDCLRLLPLRGLTRKHPTTTSLGNGGGGGPSGYNNSSSSSYHQQQQQRPASPYYAGVAAVISLSAVLVLNQHETRGVATNGFASISVDTQRITLQSWTSHEEGLELDASHWVEDRTLVANHYSDYANNNDNHNDRNDGNSNSSGGGGGGGKENNHDEHSKYKSNANPLACILVGCLKSGEVLRISMTYNSSAPGLLSSLIFSPEVIARSIKDPTCFAASSGGDLWFFGARQTACVLLRVHRVLAVNIDDEEDEEAEMVEMKEEEAQQKHLQLRLAGSEQKSSSQLRRQTSFTVGLEADGVSFLSPASKRRKRDSKEQNLSVSLAPAPEQVAKNVDDVDDEVMDDHRADDDTIEDSAQLREQMLEEEALLYNSRVVDYVRLIEGGDAVLGDTPPQKNPFSDSESMVCSYGVDDNVISNTNNSTAQNNVEYILTVKDTLPVLGPITHGIYTKADRNFDFVKEVNWQRATADQQESAVITANTAASYISERDLRDGLMLSAGLDEDGALLKVYNGLHVDKIASRSLPGALRVFSICTWADPLEVEDIHTSTAAAAAAAVDGAMGDVYGLLLIVYETRTRVLHCTEVIPPDAGHTTAAAAAGTGKTRPELSFKEISAADGGFIGTSTTLNVGVLHHPCGNSCSDPHPQPPILAQIVPEGVRVLKLGRNFGDDGDALLDMLVVDAVDLGGLGGCAGEVVIAGDVCCGSKSSSIASGYISLLTSSQTLYVLKYDVEEESLEVVSSTVCKPASDPASSAEDRPSAHYSARLGEILPHTVVSASLFVGTLATVPLSSATATAAAAAAATAGGGGGGGRRVPGTVGSTVASETSLVTTTIANPPTIQEQIEQKLLYGCVLPAEDPISAGEGTKKEEEKKVEKDEDGGIQADQSTSTTKTTTKRGKGSKSKGGTQKGKTTSASTTAAGPELPVANAVSGLSKEQVEVEEARRQQQEESQAYLVVSDIMGFVYIIRLQTMTCVFLSQQFAQLAPFAVDAAMTPTARVSATTGNSTGMNGANNNNGNSSKPGAVPSDTGDASSSSSSSSSSTSANPLEGLIVESRLARVGELGQPAALCLSLLFHTGELVVYAGVESAVMTTTARLSVEGGGGGEMKHCRLLQSFQKMHQRPVINRRSADSMNISNPSSDTTSTTNNAAKSDTGMTATGSGAAATGNGSGVESGEPAILQTLARADFRSYLSSREYKSRCGPSLNPISAFCGRSGVLVMGNDPIIVTAIQGLPSILSLGMPEVPFINYGQYCLVECTVGRTKSIAALWFEWEDIESLKIAQQQAKLGAAAAAGKLARAASLDIYQEVSHLELYPGGCVSVKRISFGQTIHRFGEILNHTDDRTQQALLQKKTFVLACSEEVRSPFLPAVLTEEELAEDSELYERYFPNVESFAQPDLLNVAPAPRLSQRKHMLAIMQNSSVVDTYELPINECVVDCEVIYFTINKSAASSTSSSSSMRSSSASERRVFVAASTVLVEKRGEDSQGNGRLLLFALDYALFGQDSDDEGDEKEEDEEEKAQEVTANDADKESVAAAVKQEAGAAAGSTAMEVDETTTSSPAKASVTTATATVAANKHNKVRHAASAQAKFLGAIKPKLRLLWSGPGPASVVKQLGTEYLASTVGANVYIYKLNHDTLELEQVSFFFAQLYITTMSVLKNFILLGDAHESVSLIYWREEDHSLHPIAHDYEPAGAVMHATYLYDGPKLGMLTVDDEGNLQLFQENPRKLESIQGTRLLCLADFHVGSEANILINHDLLSTDPVQKPMPNPLDNRPPPPPPRTRKGSNFPLQRFGTRFNTCTIPGKTTALVPTLDGGIGLVLPMEERMYRRLTLLQQIMTMTVHTPFALNPRDYRLFKTVRNRARKKRGVVDGCTLWMFDALPPSMQEQLAATVGATPYLIKENLHELDYLSRFF